MGQALSLAHASISFLISLTLGASVPTFRASAALAALESRIYSSAAPGDLGLVPKSGSLDRSSRCTGLPPPRRAWRDR